MRAVEAIRKRAVTVAPDASLRQAAELMEQTNVGALVVLDGERLVGIVTDRDIAVRGVGRDLPVDARVDAVMTIDVVTIDGEADMRAVLPIFRTHALRRIPLIVEGRVAGMLTVDDLLIDLVNDLADVVRPITGEVVFGNRRQGVMEPATSS